MFNKLTKKQKLILECPERRIVVKACPGSGKTFSVAAKLARLLKIETFKHKGIAVISFTKVACDKIKQDLSENYAISRVGYPHFVGTIDSFINQHIFLPFGHLLMGCSTRPEIIGTEYNQWYEYDSSLTKYYNKKVSYRDPNYYFDKVSFGIDDKPIPLLPANSYHFGWDWEKLTNKDGSLNKKVQDIIDIKWNHFKQGKANQADANYFSLRLLEKYPLILMSLSARYSHLIIDEAQDTTDIQMKIIEHLDRAGLKNIMFVGDPEQAIFEWNTADAELFMNKYESPDYHKIDLNENRRSSANICALLNAMINGDISSIADIKDDENIPQAIGYGSADDVHRIKQDFITKCEILAISLENTAIVFRGKSFGEEYFQLIDDSSSDNLPWVNKHYYVRDIVHGKFLSEKGFYKEGLKFLERGYHKLKNQELHFVSKRFLSEQIQKKGFRTYRKLLFEFIDLLPEIGNNKLKEWINETNAKLQARNLPMLKVKLAKANVVIKNLFHQVVQSDIPCKIGTIHSVKGQTFDALLLFLKKDSATKHYSKLINPRYNEPNETKMRKDKEELRLVYVACSRPKRLLWIAVPNDDKVIWENYFNLN